MFTTVIYKNRPFKVPVTGPDHNLDAALNDIPDDDHAMAYLLQDGNLSVPCSRYGRDTRDCAPVALILGRVHEYANGEARTFYGLDYDMGLVVNDSDDVARTLVDYGPLVGADPADYLDADEIADVESMLAIERGE